MTRPPAVAGAWLRDDLRDDVRLCRYFFLVSMIAGLFQKPLIKFAWDIDAFVSNLRAFYVASEGAPQRIAKKALGGLAILLRQICAVRGQQVITSMAMQLLSRRQQWSMVNLRTLLSRLRGL